MVAPCRTFQNPDKVVINRFTALEEWLCGMKFAAAAALEQHGTTSNNSNLSDGHNGCLAKLLSRISILLYVCIYLYIR